MPAGVFSLLQSTRNDIARALVQHPHVKAVGFTGSLRAGRALFDAAAARPEPIPVYAEMGSVNPVFILPGALAERAAAIAEGLKDSVTLGVGQFCTNPGLTIGIGDARFDGFVHQLEALMRRRTAGHDADASDLPLVRSRRAATERHRRRVDDAIVDARRRSRRLCRRCS